jgi:hypothetical protein
MKTHTFDPVKRCCVFDSDSPIHDVHLNPPKPKKPTRAQLRGKELPEGYLTHLARRGYEAMRILRYPDRLPEWEELDIAEQDGLIQAVLAILEDLSEDHP